MIDLLFGLTITVLVFALLYIADKKSESSDKDLTDEEREWLKGNK